MSFDLENRILAKFDHPSPTVTGVKCMGFYGLTFHFKIKINKQEDYPYKLSNFIAHVYFGNKQDPNNYLGIARPQTHVIFRNFNYPSGDLKFFLPVSASQLETIESLRLGKEIAFHFQIIAEVATSTIIVCLQDQVLFSISQSDWLKVLTGTGFLNMLLFEVPIPDASNNPDLADAVEALRQAQKQLILNECNLAVSQCRLALESLRKALSLNSKTRNAVDNYSDRNNRRQMSQMERELLIREVLLHYTHPPHHAGHGGTLSEYSRREAAMIVGLTSCVLSSAIKVV